MARLNVELIEIEETTIYGLWRTSNDRTVSKDVDSLSKDYHNVVQREAGTILPYFVLSKNYDEVKKEFELFIGSTTQRSGLQCVTLAGGQYAKITVKPKLGFVWGAAIGEAKRYFYTKWLPNSPYNAANMEYEFHTEKSVGKSPSIDLVFGIEEEKL